MAANTSPIFSSAPDVQFGTSALVTANAATDGTGTVLTVFTADATNGGRVERLRIRPTGTAIQTVLRVFINNGATNATATNNTLYEEITLPAVTGSQVASTTTQEIYLNISLPAGYKINCTIGTTVAAGYYVSAIGGKY